MKLLRWTQKPGYILGFAAICVGLYADIVWLVPAGLLVIAMGYDTSKALRAPAPPTSDRDIELESQLRAIHVEWMGKDTLSSLGWLESEVELAYLRWDEQGRVGVARVYTDASRNLDWALFDTPKMDEEWR